MIIREVSHVEVGEDNTTIKLHHPDGYVTGILLEPSQPFPVIGTVAIEVGRVRRVLGSPALTERLIALHQRGQETTQAHIEHWWQSAPERHRPRVEPVE